MQYIHRHSVESAGALNFVKGLRAAIGMSKQGTRSGDDRDLSARCHRHVHGKKVAGLRLHPWQIHSQGKLLEGNEGLYPRPSATAKSWGHDSLA